jgi:hypothetical protein
MDCAGSGWRRVRLIVILFRPLTPPGLPSLTGLREGTPTEGSGSSAPSLTAAAPGAFWYGEHSGACIKKGVSRLQTAEGNQPPLDLKKQAAQLGPVVCLRMGIGLECRIDDPGRASPTARRAGRRPASSATLPSSCQYPSNSGCSPRRKRPNSALKDRCSKRLRLRDSSQLTLRWHRCQRSRAADRAHGWPG